MRTDTTLIIGASSGIGKEVAWRLNNEHGRMMSVLTPSAEEFDVSDRDSMLNYLVDWSHNHVIKQVVYSAGVSRLDWVGSLLSGETEWVFGVNTFGFINLLDLLIKTNHGPADVVAVSSDAATRPMRSSIAYCASKAALDMAVKVAARELGAKGWRINAISPGMVDDTGMQQYVDYRVPAIRGWSEETTRAYERSQEVVPGRISKGSIAIEIIRLLESDTRHLNGTNLVVNGGR